MGDSYLNQLSDCVTITQSCLICREVAVTCCCSIDSDELPSRTHLLRVVLRGVVVLVLRDELLGALQQLPVHHDRRDVEGRGVQGLKAQLRRHLCQNAVRIQSEYRTE
jgi:hypothetical protein